MQVKIYVQLFLIHTVYRGFRHPKECKNTSRLKNSSWYFRYSISTAVTLTAHNNKAAAMYIPAKPHVCVQTRVKSQCPVQSVRE